MIKHIVMMKFFENAGGKSKSENLEIAKQMIDALKNEISQIVEMKAGIIINYTNPDKAFDIVIDSIFHNLEDIDIYKVHPAHMTLVDFLNIVREKTVYIDYEI